MRDALTAFVAELRAAGIPVSMVEALDAGAALPYTDLSDREHLRATLGATLVKNPRHYRAFDVAFDVFFGSRAPVGAGGDDGVPTERGAWSDDALRDAILEALAEGDTDTLRRLIREGVERYGGMQAGRPVGGRYYTYRVMRQLDADDLLRRLLAALTEIDGAFGDERLARSEAEARIEALRRQVDDEVTARLVAERGAEQVAASRRVALLEDVDLMHATRAEIDEIERVIGPLARKLATRLSQRRRHGRKGRLDVRRTIRRSLSHGGVLLEPQFKPPRTTKPEIVVLCDVSGSMATFARFTLQLTYAIATEFSNVRTFAFIDGLDEITRFFGPTTDFSEAVLRMTTDASLVRRDGHSDYGRSFEEMVSNHLDAVTPRTTLVITGDARNNYRPTGLEHLGTLTARARATYWLNPESDRFWNTGDSVMATYAPSCDAVEQVRTLRQLEAFVETVALPVSRTRLAG